jgi:ribosomal protein L24E
MKGSTRGLVVVAVVAAAISLAAYAGATNYGPWTAAVNVQSIPGTDPSFNTDQLDGCPFVSRDGKRFFMASTRAGGLGGIDIWVAARPQEGDPWGAPVNVGAPVNSSANDFCPTLAGDGQTFLFVSNRLIAGACGGADMYTTRLRRDGTFKEPQHLGCGVNSAADEASPFPIGAVLYFSSTRPGGYSPEAPGATVGDSDLYVSEWQGGAYGAPALVQGANTASEDGQPNVRRDGRELFFYSNRPGTLGGNDIYAATRRWNEPWSTPANLGPNVNSAASETRPSLSWDGNTLYFGSTRPGGEGMSDIYVTTRAR